MNKEICNKNVNVTSIKEAFTLAYMNLHLNQDENMTNLQSLIGTTILKIQIEERKKEEERQKINNLLKSCFMYDTLRSTVKYIQKVIDREDLIIFRFNSKWFLKIVESDIKRNTLLAYRTIDKKAILINKSTFQNLRIENIIEVIKAHRDMILFEKDINDYQEYFNRLEYLGS